MKDWSQLWWQFFFIVNCYKLGLRANPLPSAEDAPTLEPDLLEVSSTNDTSSPASTILEVSAGETVKILCPSNDNDHRFMFWHLRGNAILSPGSNIDKRKYKYEVLSGTLFIKAVSPAEYGNYTCYSKHLEKMTWNAKSILLVVKSDWQELWEDDEVNFFRMAAIFVVILVLCVAAYVIKNNMRHHKLMRFRDLTNDEEDSSRKSSYDRLGNSRNVELREGIDNPILDTDLRFSRESTPAFVYTRDSNY